MATPSATVCFEKYKLLQQFASAVSEYHRMQSAQFAAVLSGDGFAFEEEIARAAQQREQAKYDILAHQQQHG